MPRKVAVLPGDGIGPEVVDEAVKVLKATQVEFDFEFALVGGAAYDAVGHPLPPETLDLCRASDAILLGAVGGAKWDKVEPIEMRPEIGALLPLRSELNLYANLRPVQTLRPLLHASPLKEGRNVVDMMVVRELTSGIYFGKPRERRDNGQTAIDTCYYTKAQVQQIAVTAFELARKRGRKIVSVDKANVLETSRLWRETVTEVSEGYPDVSLSHMLVDNCAMQLIRDPQQFDIILTENMFGDILSDEASVITGSLGLLPSASIGGSKQGATFGMYEPVHGSAPDIAGQGRANPLATILSAAMMLRYSFDLGDVADRVEAAVEAALDDGLRTADIFEKECKLVSTSEMGDAVAAKLHF